jgi:hypothetical protein
MSHTLEVWTFLSLAKFQSKADLDLAWNALNCILNVISLVAKCGKISKTPVVSLRKHSQLHRSDTSPHSWDPGNICCVSGADTLLCGGSGTSESGYRERPHGETCALCTLYGPKLARLSSAVILTKNPNKLRYASERS